MHLKLKFKCLISSEKMFQLYITLVTPGATSYLAPMLCAAHRVRHRWTRVSPVLCQHDPAQLLDLMRAVVSFLWC